MICEFIVKRLKIWYYLLLNYFEFILLRLLVVQKVPQHVALIMDGNRRYSREMNLPIGIGHLEGLRMMQSVLRWLFLLRVPEVTVYAFSIDNFKRPKAEVSILESIGRNAIMHVKRNEGEYRNANMRFQILGRLDMLPKDISDALAYAEDETRDCTGFKLNFAVGYTSQDDIVGAIKNVCQKVEKNEMSPEDVDEKEVERNLRTNRCSSPDMLIRTSGETRLSNFLLWELSDAMLYFLPKNWPSLTLWDILKALLHFQRYSENLPKRNGVKVELMDENSHVEDAENLLNHEMKSEMYIMDNFQRYTKLRGIQKRI